MLRNYLPLPRFGQRLCLPRPFARVRLSHLNTGRNSSVRTGDSIYNLLPAVSKQDSASKTYRTRYAPIEDIDPFERYTAGGYLPVRLGDQFHSSPYRIVHKLGYETSSTMWLARDECLAKYVAIKIAVPNLARPLKVHY